MLPVAALACNCIHRFDVNQRFGLIKRESEVLELDQVVLGLLDPKRRERTDRSQRLKCVLLDCVRRGSCSEIVNRRERLSSKDRFSSRRPNVFDAREATSNGMVISTARETRSAEIDIRRKNLEAFCSCCCNIATYL